MPYFKPFSSGRLQRKRKIWIKRRKSRFLSHRKPLLACWSLTEIVESKQTNSFHSPGRFLFFDKPGNVTWSTFGEVLRWRDALHSRSSLTAKCLHFYILALPQPFFGYTLWNSGGNDWMAWIAKTKLEEDFFRVIVVLYVRLRHPRLNLLQLPVLIL